MLKKLCRNVAKAIVSVVNFIMLLSVSEDKERRIFLRIKFFSIRLLWKMFVWWHCIFSPKRPARPAPQNFQTFYGFDDALDKDGLIKAYAKVFSTPPWNELWKRGDVLEKLKRETQGPQSVTTLMRDHDQSVCGFMWGQVLDVAGLEQKIQPGLGLLPVGLEAAIKKRGVKKLFYLYEIAILSGAREGLNPGRFLMRPGLALATKEKVHQSLFWSTAKSKIVNLALIFGYEAIYACKDANGHDIVFFLHPNHRYFLKVLELLDERKAAKIMWFFRKVLSVL